MPATGRGDTIFEVNAAFAPDGTIGEYTTSGVTVNPALITGLSNPQGIVVSGSNLFVVNFGYGTIGEYTTSGATVNASLVMGLNDPVDLVVVPVPEPSIALLLSAGIVGLAVRRRRGRGTTPSL